MKTATAILVVLAMFVVTGTTSAQNTDKVVKVEICEVMSNPCCGEDVEICVEVMRIFDKDGNLKHISYNGTGTGLATGTVYTMKAVANQHQNEIDPGAGNVHMAFSMKLVATDDSDCSFTMRGVMHFTVKPDGTPAAMIQNAVIECENGTVIE